MSLIPSVQGQDFFYATGARLNWHLEITKSVPTDVVPDATAAWQIRLSRPDCAEDLVLDTGTSPALAVVDITDGVAMALVFKDEDATDTVDVQRLPRGTRIYAEIANTAGADTYFWQNLTMDPSEG